jgi:peroxiredoxin
VAVDPPDLAGPLVTKLGLTFPVLCDADLATIKRYGVLDAENGIAWPAVFVVGKDGKVVWRSLTDNYKVRPSSEEVLRAIPAAKGK